MPRKIAIHLSSGVLSNFYQADEKGNFYPCKRKFDFMFSPFISSNIFLSADVCRSDYADFQSQDFESLNSFEFSAELPLDMPQAYGEWLARHEMAIDQLIVVMLPCEASLYNLPQSSNTFFKTHPFIVETLNAESILKLKGLSKRLAMPDAAYSPAHPSLTAEINRSLQHANPEGLASPATSVSNCAIESLALEERVDLMAHISNAKRLKTATNTAAVLAALTSIDSRSR